MSRVVVCGSGICGIGAALMLAEDGHDVTLLERDPIPLPDSPARAWDEWDRNGVAQFRQPHNFMPGLRQVLEAELPGVYAALPKAGAYRWDIFAGALSLLADKTPRPIDEKFTFWTARRPVGEWVFAQAAENHPRIDLRRGVKVTGLTRGPEVRPGIPHVAGVRTSDGDIRADVVVDAMGRRSTATDWLVEIGARAPTRLPKTPGSPTTPATSPALFRKCSARRWLRSVRSRSSGCRGTTRPGR